jgi:hypothetical protein
LRLDVRDDLQRTRLPQDVQEVIVARCREAKWVAKVWILRKNLTTVTESTDLVAVSPKLLAFASQARLNKLAEVIAQDVVVCRLYEEGLLMRRLDALGAQRPLR